MDTAQPLRLPSAWIRAGSAPDRYDMGVVAPRSPAVIRSRAEDAAPPEGTDGKWILHPQADGPREFGTLMQSVSAAQYRGKRVRLRAELKTEDVRGAGTIWMRVDGGRRTLRFDNMESRSVAGVISGTHDWATREVVLDVPAEADSLHFGLYLRGKGETLARNFELAEVDDDVAVTSRQYFDLPTNLDFSELDDR